MRRRERTIEDLEKRIDRADKEADTAERIRSKTSDEAIGAEACRLTERASNLRGIVSRWAEDRDVWAATAGHLRERLTRERRELGTE
jgi:hypothetical protein